MKVVATSEEAVLRVAFLYSCGTENALYKELEKDSDAILYAGAPYNQESYAYGISVHVGPVAGCQPPLAPGRETKANSSRSINALTLVANWLRSAKARRLAISHFPLEYLHAAMKRRTARAFHRPRRYLYLRIP
ncbi:hypothetical protein EOS_13425 [Caballeronia mineralivorans PML1(12)]|uniref:Uncharacterized protein n=1 Tax=Caballeronia mineralivorans PML1(12) TaxID=908627 RepID=A0A0J1CYR7_9BURK|nr:hypothetical protein EOS_13425 [Caballeronia mineralivorans PML1(12)]